MVYFKRIFFIFIIAITFYTTVFAVGYDGIDYSYSDNNENILNDYESLTRDFLIRLNRALQSDNSSTRQTAETIITQLNNGYFLYVWRGNITDYTDIPGDTMVASRLFRPRYLTFILYRNVSSTAVHNNLSYQGYDGTLWNTQFYDVGSTYSRFGVFDYNNVSLDNDSGSNQNYFVIPRMLISYTTESLQTFRDRYSDSLSNQQIVEILNDILDETQEISDFLQDDSLNNNNIDFNGVDSYEFTYYNNDIERAFLQIQTAFTDNNTYRYIIFSIPFTNRSITIDTQFLHNLLNDNNLTIIVDIMQAFWWYFFCKLIVYDILKIVQAISTGDFLTNKTDSLITIDML